MIFRSLCSGIEAASVAWEPLGWKADAFAEIEAFPSAVLAHHYPNTPNLGDMTKFKDWPDAAFDVLVGGTPCQSFSVAGLRKGMADPRGNLALVYLGIADRYRPRWLVWENVPGVLSSNQGRDFGAFLGGLAELGYGFAYRVLDAQFFGLAQRRKRVFVVGCLGDWRRAAAVLFEPHSLSGHPAPRREAWKRTAPTLSARTKGGGGLGTDFDCDGGLIAFGGNDTRGPIDVATAQTAHGGTGRMDFESETFIAHALRAEVFDASEDGTGRGTPLVPVQGVALRGREEGGTAELTGDVMTALRCGGGGGDKPHVLAPIAFSAKDHGADAMTDLSPTLRAGGHSESHANAGVMPAIAFRTTGNDGVYETGDAVSCLNTATDPNQNIFMTRAAVDWRVRRPTPRECERLQGFPDDYTLIPLTNKRGQHTGKWAKDGPRYKALGNSMAVPVMRWIGERIAAVDAMRRAA